MIGLFLAVWLLALPVHAAPGKAPHPIFIDAALRQRLSLQKGDILEISRTPNGPWQSFTVTGLKEPRYDPLTLYYTNRSVIMNLGDLQSLANKRGEASFIAIGLKNKAGFPEAAAITSLLGFPLHRPRDFAEQALALADSFARFGAVIGWLSLGAGALFLLSLMVLKVEEEKKEAGYLLAVGIGKGTIFRILLFDGILLTLAGTGIGLLLGTAGCLSINLFFRWYFHKPETYFAIFTGPLYLKMAALAVGVGILSTVAALVRLLPAPIMELLNPP